MTNAEFVQSLRALADFYEAHPTLRPAYSMSGNDVSIYAEGKLEVVDAARQFGACKNISDDTFYRVQKAEPIGMFMLQALDYHWNVCTRKVVGHRTVKQQVPTAFEEREVREEVVEWDCPEVPQ